MFDDCRTLTLGFRLDPSKIIALTEAVLERLDSVDQGGPTLRSVLITNPQLRAEAVKSARDAADGHWRGPLHGVPVLLKDNIDTQWPMPTTAGSLALQGKYPLIDAPVVRLLRARGALILGKANLSEWGNFRASISTRGWSACGGLVKNPHALDRSAAGSSSGSAAAVAAGIATLSVGTETDGSIVAPAEVNGIVGIKPTVGLLSNHGIVPISSNQDTPGPLARSVRDACVLLDAPVARSQTAQVDGSLRPTDTYVAFCEPSALQGLRVGVPRLDYWAIHPKVHPLFERALAVLTDGGARVTEGLEVPAIADLADSSDELTVLLYDFKSELPSYLRHRGERDLRDVDDVVAFNLRHRDRELQYFGQDILEASAAKGSRREPEYRRALRAVKSLGREHGIDYALRSAGADCLLVPGVGPAWKSDLINGDGPNLQRMASSVQMAAVAGYPAISVPIGLVGGLPVGAIFMGTAWTEGLLIRASYGLEQGLRLDVQPSFRPAAAG